MRRPRLTHAEHRRDADAEKVLEGQEEGQEEAVLGPEPSDGLPPPPGQDDDQPAPVEDHHEVHALADHVHRHQEADLEKQGEEEAGMKGTRTG